MVHYIAFIWCSLELVVLLLVETFIKWLIVFYVSTQHCKKIIFFFEVVRLFDQSSLYLGDFGQVYEKKLLRSAYKEACCSISHF